MRRCRGRVSLITVTYSPPSRRYQPGSRHPAFGTKLLPIKCSLDLRKRLKVAAAEEGLTYAECIWHLLDVREDRIKRQQRAQPSPLHRPLEV